MSEPRQLQNRVRSFRQGRGWSQEELAQRASVSRAAVSAIEINRLVPSVAAALALAAAFGCRVEDLFGGGAAPAQERPWAWPPAQEPCRFWHAHVAGRPLLFPVESTVAGVLRHDGIFRDGAATVKSEFLPDDTLVMASCDPAGSLLAAEVARTSGFRLLVLPRSSRNALDLLRRGLVDIAGLHLATAKNEEGNATAVASALGAGFSLLKVARWQEGLAVGQRISASSVRALLHAGVHWIGREPGSGARLCQDELLQRRPAPRRVAHDHRAVATAIRCGWADVGVCVRLACEEGGLRFISVRDEYYDLCFSTAMETDPRVRALLQVVRSVNYRSWLGDLPGYDSKCAGELLRVS